MRLYSNRLTKRKLIDLFKEQLSKSIMAMFLFFDIFFEENIVYFARWNKCGGMMMKRRVVKPLIVQMIGVLLTQCVILEYNPLATAWLGAVTAVGGGYFIMFPLMIVGLFNSMGIIGCVKYGTLMVAVMNTVLLHRKKSKTVNINSIAVITGASTLLMELGEWFMDTDLTTLYGENLLYDSYYRLFIIFMLTLVSGSGSMVFCIAIKGFLENGLNMSIKDDNKMWTDRRIESAAMGFRYLSDRIMNLPGADMKNKDTMNASHLANQLTGEVCAECVNSGVCWGSKSQNSKKNIMNMIELAKNNGKVSREILPEEVSAQCINQGELITGVNSIFERARLNFIWRSRMEEGREAVALQLNEMADIIESFGEKDYAEEKKYDRAKRVVGQLLKEMKNPARKISISRVDGGIIFVEIKLMKKMKKGFDRKKFGGEVSKLLQVKMSYELCSDITISMVQDTNFNVICKVAKRVKENEPISGDNYSITKLKFGKCLLSVCDGMGVGKKAGKYSGIVLDMLEQLMKNGFEKETSLKLINSTLMCGNQWDSPMAIDVGMIDLYSGTCNLVKMGAACTYIKRGNWVECIKSTTLPIGSVKSAEMETVSKKLYNGDFVIMISDGVTDGFEAGEREEAVGRIIMDIDTNNPQKLANQILESVEKKLGTRRKDDMTVLVAGIWDKI